jgi:hypothetical protein
MEELGRACALTVDDGPDEHAPQAWGGLHWEARREATLDDRIGLAARVAADLLPQAGDSRAVEAGEGL